MAGEWLTLWTVRGAVILYAIALALRFSNRSESSQRRSRLLWTVGYMLFVVHVLCAFHFYHAWSHRAAWESTARQTHALTGMSSGGGLYANYAFIIVWGVDVLWWWSFPRHYRHRHFLTETLVQGFLAFMTFNATVVFATGVSRWIGFGIVILLTGCVLRGLFFYGTDGTRGTNGADGRLD